MSQTAYERNFGELFPLRYRRGYSYDEENAWWVGEIFSVTYFSFSRGLRFVTRPASIRRMSRDRGRVTLSFVDGGGQAEIKVSRIAWVYPIDLGTRGLPPEGEELDWGEWESHHRHERQNLASRLYEKAVAYDRVEPILQTAEDAKPKKPLP